MQVWSNIKLTAFILSNTPSDFILLATRSALAKQSMAPICDISISSTHVDSLLTLQSKFKPPGAKPP